MLTHLGGIDHGVVLVRDLDAAAASFVRLGFTITPRGTHSPHMGTGNACVMLRQDYFELLGVLVPTELNARWRRLLESREGISAIALRAHDADAGRTELEAHGIATLPVQHFGRPVALPGGHTTATKFQTFHVAEPPAPGLRMFACQHLTPEATWVAGLVDHANTAEGLEAIEVLALDPADAAAGVGQLLDRKPVAEPDGAMRLETGATALVFLTAGQLAARYPGLDLGGLAEEGPVTLAIRVGDRAAAAGCVAGTSAIEGSYGIAVPPAAAHGIILAFR